MPTWNLSAFIAAPDHQSDHHAFITTNPGPYCVGTFVQAGTIPADEAKAIAERLIESVNGYAQLQHDHDRHLRCTQVMIDHAKAKTPWYEVEVEPYVRQVQAEEVAYRTLNRRLIETVNDLLANDVPLSSGWDRARHCARTALADAEETVQVVTQYERRFAQMLDRNRALVEALTRLLDDATSALDFGTPFEDLENPLHESVTRARGVLK